MTKFEPQSQLIAWLEDTMIPNKPYYVTEVQVQKLKDSWDVIGLSKWNFTFNSSFTKIIKR